MHNAVSGKAARRTFEESAPERRNRVLLQFDRTKQAPETPGLDVWLRQDAPIRLEARLSCAPGELLALVGPSGAGKTTILRAIAGLIAPREGRVACGGEVWLDTSGGVFIRPYRRRVGLVFQSYALFPHMNALGNVAAALGHLPAAKRRERAAELLASVHLHGLEERRPAELSGGQQQRVALARALARDPAVMLLDEPFSAVDRRTRRALHEEIAELRGNLRIPMVLVTHDLGEVAALADRVCVLDAGQTLICGAPDEVLSGPMSARIRETLDLPDQEAPRRG
jgi:molybdate transport system ATP-binding protein